MDNDGNYPDFKEYPLQSSFHQLIPARAQRGLSTFDVEFTCLDADESYLAIGSNVGIAYLVNREKDDLHKLKDNEHKIPVSSIKVLVSLECLVAVGFRNGAVVVYKVPFQENQELEKFTVEGLHSSAITALEWSKNGMKFFSGDENGIVVCTEIDHLEHQSRSRLLMNEKSKIVQLSYSHFNLVVSTVFRSLIYSLKSNTFCQIGQKERKCFGPFGVIIFEEQNAVHEQNSIVYASRPGQRLWKSDMSGVIQETLIFKNALSESCPLIETLTKNSENVSFNDFQFERLARFESYIIIWSDSYVVLIDPDKKLVVAASPKLDPIIDVATCKNEIFILRGLRHILRISSVPDTYNATQAVAEEPSLMEDILEPLKGLSTFVKERSDSLSVQTESSTNIFDWLKKKRSASSPAELPNDVSESDGLKKDDSLPDIVSLDSNEYIPVKIDASPASMNDIPEFITKDFTNNNDTDDLVYKVKKKNKKTKKVQFVIDAAPSRKRFISSTSTKENVEEELPNNEVNLNIVPNNVPNALEINSVLSDSSTLESTNSCDIDMQLKNGQNINEIVDNINKTSDTNYVDSDKLLENVLIAYSHSKHKDLPSKDSNNANTSDFMDVSDLNQNVNFESDKEVSNAFSEDIHHDNSNTDVNESAMGIVNNDSDTKQIFDSDDIFSPVSNDGSERKMSKSESSMDSLSLDDSSISSTSSKNNDPPKYGVDWVQYKAPELLLDISVSCDHIFCVDVRNKAHFSPHPQMGSLNWIELDQPAEKIASSNLETVVWTLYRGTVFAAVHKALCLWENTEWLSIARDVVSIAVDDECGCSTSSKNNDPPKYGVDWVQYKAPELLLDISVSCDHIFCVDVRNKAHFSPHPQMGSLNWIELDQPAEKIASSNLETVVWTLYRGTVFAAVHKALCLWENTEWLSIARDVVSIAVDDECGCSTSSKNNDPPKYGVDWVQYKAPELLLDISVSCDHIFCVDVRNKAHFSPHPQMGSLNWIELDQPAEKIASSNLETVVWTLYRGTVFAAVHKALCLWENTEWLSIARDVVSIAVDDECGWYAKSNGELITQQNLTLTKPCNYPENVPCNSPALQVAIKDGVLWVLTISGSLLARKSTDGKKSKSVWKEIILNDIPGIDSIYLGYKKTGWIIDSSGFIHFIINVTPEIPEGTGQPWIVEASNYLFHPATRASASLEQVVRRTLNSETLTNLIRGKQHLRLSASSMGVWFCKTYDNLLYCNQNNIIGHNWEMVIPPNTAVATKWSLLAADEMNNSEGSLWCVNSTDELFCYDIKSQTLLLVESPSASRIRCLQPKYQTLWLLSEDGSIYIRRGITPSCLQGIWWQALDLVQFGAQQISHISCSSFVSWACTSNGEVFMRLGSVSPTSSNLNQAWVAVNVDYEQINTPLDKLSAIRKHIPLPLIPTQFSEDGGFCQVYVGPQGYPVWAIDKRRNVYAREGVSTNLPIGEKWTVIPDLHAKKLCISNNAVWLLRPSGKIYRRFGVTEKNPCGDYWKQMPGNLDLISVTEDDDLWGLQDGSIYCHYSFVLYDTLNSAQQKPPQRMISEEDWEDIMADDFEVL